MRVVLLELRTRKLRLSVEQSLGRVRNRWWKSSCLRGEAGLRKRRFGDVEDLIFIY